MGREEHGTGWTGSQLTQRHQLQEQEGQKKVAGSSLTLHGSCQRRKAVSSPVLYGYYVVTQTQQAQGCSPAPACTSVP